MHPSSREYLDEKKTCRYIMGKIILSSTGPLLDFCLLGDQHTHQAQLRIRSPKNVGIIAAGVKSLPL